MNEYDINGDMIWRIGLLAMFIVTLNASQNNCTTSVKVDDQMVAKSAVQKG